MGTCSSVFSGFYLLSRLWIITVLPQLDLGLRQAQLPQAGQLLLPVLQRLELREAPHSLRLLPKRPVERRRGKAPPLGDTSTGQECER